MPEQRKKSGDLVGSLSDKLHALCLDGPIVGDRGRRFPVDRPLLKSDFIISFEPLAGQAGSDPLVTRPNFLVHLPNGFCCRVAIGTGGVILGDPGNWGRTLKLFTEANRADLMAAWTEAQDPKIWNIGVP